MSEFVAGMHFHNNFDNFEQVWSFGDEPGVQHVCSCTPCSAFLIQTVGQDVFFFFDRQPTRIRVFPHLLIFQHTSAVFIMYLHNHALICKSGVYFILMKLNLSVLGSPTVNFCGGEEIQLTMLTLSTDSYSNSNEARQ